MCGAGLAGLITIVDLEYNTNISTWLHCPLSDDSAKFPGPYPGINSAIRTCNTRFSSTVQLTS